MCEECQITIILVIICVFVACPASQVTAGWAWQQRWATCALGRAFGVRSLFSADWYNHRHLPARKGDINDFWWFKIQILVYWYVHFATRQISEHQFVILPYSFSFRDDCWKTSEEGNDRSIEVSIWLLNASKDHYRQNSDECPLVNSNTQTAMHV